MTSDIDIYASANELIKQHGEDAPIHAAMRADELLDQGDLDGQAVWKRILNAVDELLSEKVPDGATVN
jgi:hypothetical protein